MYDQIELMQWIRRVILSCVNLDQLENAEKLIALYAKHFSFDFIYHTLQFTLKTHRIKIE